MGTQQAIVKTFGVGSAFLLFGFQTKVRALVTVDAPRAARAIPVMKSNRALKHVILLRRGVWLIDFQ